MIPEIFVYKSDKDEDDYESSLIQADEAAGLSWARFEVHRDKNHWIPMRRIVSK